jgi:hypothetical protein
MSPGITTRFAVEAQGNRLAACSHKGPGHWQESEEGWWRILHLRVKKMVWGCKGRGETERTALSPAWCFRRGGRLQIASMAEGAPQVTLTTTIGDITVELYYKHAPKTCKNFLELARKGYYNNVVVRAAVHAHGALAATPQAERACSGVWPLVRCGSCALEGRAVKGPEGISKRVEQSQALVLCAKGVLWQRGRGVVRAGALSA